MTRAERSLPERLMAVRACRFCTANLPLGPRPVLQAGAGARILVAGQAPGARVQASGVTWDDASGERLRAWMDVDKPALELLPALRDRVRGLLDG